MSDARLRELERAAAVGGVEDERRYQDALCALERGVWILRYDKDACGLDNVLVGVFGRRQAALDHIEHHEAEAWPGVSSAWGRRRDQPENGRWVTGSGRGLVLDWSPVLLGAEDAWFAA